MENEEILKEFNIKRRSMIKEAFDAIQELKKWIELVKYLDKNLHVELQRALLKIIPYLEEE